MRSVELFQVVAEVGEVTHIVTPVFLYLDEGLEHHLLAEEGFDVLAGKSAETAEHRALFAYEDTLLAVSFAVDDGRDVDEFLPLLEALY